jgi:N-acetyl-1-D-myo-inositol-2-amino-2-deoxy-alpha-D-glucopyranoside deacetylase
MILHMAHIIVGLANALVFALLGTVFHQTSLAGVPIGLVMAMAATFVYAVSIRANKTRSWSFAIGYAALVALSAQEIGFDRMVPANQAGLIWSFGSIVAVLLVAMFPRFR